MEGGPGLFYTIQSEKAKPFGAPPLWLLFFFFVRGPVRSPLFFFRGRGGLFFFYPFFFFFFFFFPFPEVKKGVFSSVSDTSPIDARLAVPRFVHSQVWEFSSCFFMLRGDSPDIRRLITFAPVGLPDDFGSYPI